MNCQKGAFWLQYGFLKGDYVMITVNVVSVSLFMGYCIFFLVLASKKRTFSIHFGLVLISISAMLFWCNISPNIDHLGFICMMFNIINFGAPLAGLGVVLRTKNTSSLPLPMCIANLLVSSQWFLYGNFIKDPYIMAPNGVGIMLAVLQLSLFIVYPMREQERSPLQKVTGLLGVGDVESNDWIVHHNKFELDVHIVEQKVATKTFYEDEDKERANIYFQEEARARYLQAPNNPIFFVIFSYHKRNSSSTTGSECAGDLEHQGNNVFNENTKSELI
ncbi:hypothetical protein WR25_20948 [Diploscapter pachys]|uniref:Sugar transporter SWEET n=1 Tax=Diploscapter pachys TaxID=2018661 RepID=A0A2A2LKJ4_9BILA|nr:hypothetical protein WR25_20948 [Diploscapter pachys]